MAIKGHRQSALSTSLGQAWVPARLRGRNDSSIAGLARNSAPVAARFVSQIETRGRQQCWKSEAFLLERSNPQIGEIEE
jgi:hypothetical protein